MSDTVARQRNYCLGVPRFSHIPDTVVRCWLMEPSRNHRKLHEVAFVTSEGALWTISPLDEDWFSYVRFVAIDGRPVIAELRVLPTAAQFGEVGDPWMAPALDRTEWPEPPDEGLTSRALRRVHLGQAVDLAHKQIQKLLDRDREPRLMPKFTAEAVSAPRQPGRRGRDDRFYATVAAIYVEALERDPRRPVVLAAQMLSKRRRGTFKPAYVRDLLHVARQRGLLTRPPKGRAGGQLTGKARAALAADEDAG